MAIGSIITYIITFIHLVGSIYQDVFKFFTSQTEKLTQECIERARTHSQLFQVSIMRKIRIFHFLMLEHKMENIPLLEYNVYHIKL